MQNFMSSYVCHHGCSNPCTISYIHAETESFNIPKYCPYSRNRTPIWIKGESVRLLNVQ